jgi:hypothetical protein
MRGRKKPWLQERRVPNDGSGCTSGRPILRQNVPENALGKAGQGARLAVVEESVLTNRARYDPIAEWYLPWVGTSPGLICDRTIGVMADRLDGQHWLDAACGAGRTLLGSSLGVAA